MGQGSHHQYEHAITRMQHVICLLLCPLAQSLKSLTMSCSVFSVSILNWDAVRQLQSQLPVRSGAKSQNQSKSADKASTNRVHLKGTNDTRDTHRVSKSIQDVGMTAWRWDKWRLSPHEQVSATLRWLHVAVPGPYPSHRRRRCWAIRSSNSESMFQIQNSKFKKPKISESLEVK